MEKTRIIIFVVLVILAALHAAKGCENGRIRCPNGITCIPVHWICDGGNDCADNSDEAYCKETRPITCPIEEFQCSDRTCIHRSGFCDGINICGDNSDEFYCDLETSTRCPPNWVRCNDTRRCIQGNWVCDGIKDCFDGSDESDCGDEMFPLRLRKLINDTAAARESTVQWLLSKRKNVFSTAKWGHELNRIAPALYLADPHFFDLGNKIGVEMAYELTTQLLYKLSGNNTMRNEELALYVQALSITCVDPRDFFGHNLVHELRKRVEASNYTNPIEILVLCNAGDTMTYTDTNRVVAGFDSQHRPYWTDTQAIAVMALQCMSARNVSMDNSMEREIMQDDLKKRQFSNGTVGNLMTTALVVQALLYNDSYMEDFDIAAAINNLMENQKSDGSWGSIRNSYYVLPVLSFKSLLNINSSHCIINDENVSEDEALDKLQNLKGEKFVVQYSVWIGKDVDLGRTWRLRVPASRNNSFYDVIETLRKLEYKHNVKYNIIEGKPYVSTLYDKEDDPELGLYWFTYVRSLKVPEGPKLFEASPADIMVLPDQELILWYKPGRWSSTAILKYYAQKKFELDEIKSITIHKL